MLDSAVRTGAEVVLRKYSIHIMAVGILVLALAFLPAHMRSSSAQWLYEQAMAICGPTGVFPIFGKAD